MSMSLLLSDITQLLGCNALEQDTKITGAVIDSRKIAAGNLFVALPGEHVDGHQYLAQARAAGASAALVSQRQNDSLPQIVVDDVTQAFGQIAQYWRQQCTAKVIAITGSNGKTTVKEMVAAILRQCGTVVATQGNLNNELGVPLTLCSIDKTHDYAVIEMGANHMGEIALLTQMVDPDVALVTNVARAHIEGFGSIDGVAQAKSEIYVGMRENSIGIVNADIAFVTQWKQILAGRKCITFGLDNPADIDAKDLQIDPASSHFMVELDGEFHYINLPLPGSHNVANSLAAIAIASALNVPVTAIEKGLAAIKSIPHRLQFRAGMNGSQIIDDTYNANPDSYKQALAALTTFSGEHWLVLGDFAELGDDSEQLHKQMGLDAKNVGVERLWVIGSSSKEAANSFGKNAIHFDDIAVLQQQLQNEITQDVTCLIKGSRCMQLDQLADALAEEGES